MTLILSRKRLLTVERDDMPWKASLDALESNAKLTVADFCCIITPQPLAGRGFWRCELHDVTCVLHDDAGHGQHGVEDAASFTFLAASRGLSEPLRSGLGSQP
jgi:hypothetical protein